MKKKRRTDQETHGMIECALERLAGLFPGETLEAQTNPVSFLYRVIDEIEDLRAKCVE